MSRTTDSAADHPATQDVADGHDEVSARKRQLTPEAQRALAEAQARRDRAQSDARAREIRGREGEVDVYSLDL